MECKVINLDLRPDRWAEVQRELNQYGFKNYQRFPAIKDKSQGDKGCMMSHIECLRGEGEILIFEDDVIFIEDFHNKFINCLNELPKDFDLFYLGANVKSPAMKFSEHLWRATEGVHCTHAMLYSENGRKIFNEHIKEILRCGLIDHWFYLSGLKLMKAYVANPLLAFQRAGHSNVRNEWFDYKGEMLDNAKNNMK